MHDITNKYRKARKGNTELVVLEGAHAFKHAIRFGANIIHVALKKDAEAEKVLRTFGGDKELKAMQNNAEIVSDEIWESLSPNNPSTGLIALAEKPTMNTDLIGNTVVFVENPNSLFNVGAIIRTLAAAGVESFIMTGRHNPWHADCISTSRGLHFALKHISLLKDINQLKKMAEKNNYSIYAMDTNTDITIEELKKGDDKKILMFGTERDGLSKEALQIAEKTVKIPMRDGVSSLNLASSVAITVYSIR